MKYIVQQAFRFNTLLQSVIIFFYLLQEMTHITHHNALREASEYECVLAGSNLPEIATKKWRYCVTGPSLLYKIGLLRNRNFRKHLLPIRNWFAGLTFVLTFHLLTSYVQARKKTLLYFPCPTALHMSTVSDTVLRHVQFPPYLSCAMLFETVFHLHPLHHSRDFFFKYCDKYNTWYCTIQFLQDHQYVCISCS